MALTRELWRLPLPNTNKMNKLKKGGGKIRITYEPLEQPGPCVVLNYPPKGMCVCAGALHNGLGLEVPSWRCKVTAVQPYQEIENKMLRGLLSL